MVSRPDGARRDGRDDEAKNENLDSDKTGAKDGHNSPDNYADEDGEAMKESSNGHRTQGENDPDSGDGNDANGEEIKESGTIRLKDIVNGIVGTGAVGKLRRK